MVGRKTSSFKIILHEITFAYLQMADKPVSIILAVPQLSTANKVGISSGVKLRVRSWLWTTDPELKYLNKKWRSH